MNRRQFLAAMGLGAGSLYLPSLGFCLLRGLLFHRLTLFRGAGAQLVHVGSRIALTMVLLAYVLLTWSRSIDWESNRTVFEACTRVNPASPRANATWQRRPTCSPTRVTGRRESTR